MWSGLSSIGGRSEQRVVISDWCVTGSNFGITHQSPITKFLRGFEGGWVAAVGAAVDAFAAAGGDGSAAAGALDHCVGGSAIGDAVGGVDLFDFVLQLLVGEAGLGSQEIPHGVAG